MGKDQKFAKSIFGQYAVDYEKRVDFERLRKERLENVQEGIRNAELGGLLLYDPINIRYTTGTRYGGSGLVARKFLRFVLVPGQGDPILYEYPYAAPHSRKLVDNVELAKSWWYFYAGENAESMAKEWAKEVAAALRRWVSSRKGLVWTTWTSMDSRRWSVKGSRSRMPPG